MNLTFLGIGSAYNPSCKNSNAILPIDDCLLMFDCGESAFETLYSNGLLEKYNTFIVAITHFHSDHVGSLGSFISYCHCQLHKKVYLVYPNENIQKLLSFTGVPGSMYTHLTPTMDMPCNKLHLTAVEVQHDPMIDCFGYLVNVDGEKFFFGGDSAAIPANILTLLEEKKIDTIYQDVTYEHIWESTCHGTLEGLCEQVSDIFRNQIVCMHLGSDFVQKIETQGFRIATMI